MSEYFRKRDREVFLAALAVDAGDVHHIGHVLHLHDLEDLRPEVQSFASRILTEFANDVFEVADQLGAFADDQEYDDAMTSTGTTAVSAVTELEQAPVDKPSPAPLTDTVSVTPVQTTRTPAVKEVKKEVVALEDEEIVAILVDNDEALSQSPNEAQAIRLIVNNLREDTDSQDTHINDLQQAAYGKRLKRDEAARLEQILDHYAAIGLLSKRGKNYGYKSTIVAVVDKVASGNLILDPAEYSKRDRVFEVINNSHEFRTKNQFNIGEVVRQYFQQSSVDRDVFVEMRDYINGLVDEDYLRHLGGAWYSTGDKDFSTDEAEALVNIQTAPLALPTKIQAVTVTEPTETSESGADAVTHEDFDVEQAGLTDREQSMLKDLMESDVFTDDDWFARGQIEFSDEVLGLFISRNTNEFSPAAFNQAFPIFAKKLIDAGVLEHNNKTRAASRYKRGLGMPVPTDTQDTTTEEPLVAPATAPKRVEVATTASPAAEKPLRFYDQQHEADTADEAEEVDERNLRRSDLRFITAIEDYVVDLLANSETALKRVEVTEMIAEQAGLTASEAKEMIANFVKDGIVNSKKEGQAKWLYHPSEDAPNIPVKKQEIEDKKITEEDISTAKTIIDIVQNMDHAQRWLQYTRAVPTVMKELGLSDPKARRSIRRFIDTGLFDTTTGSRNIGSQGWAATPGLFFRPASNYIYKLFKNNSELIVAAYASENPEEAIQLLIEKAKDQ